MAITNSFTNRYAAAAKVEAQENSIVSVITSGAYQVDSVGANKITVIGVTTPTISDYTPGSLSYEVLSDNKVDIAIDQKKSFGFQINQVEQAQSTPDYVPPAVTKAGKSLALASDDFVLGLWASQVGGVDVVPEGNIVNAVGTTLEIVEANAPRYLALLARKLRDNHVARGDMWAVIPPWFMDKLTAALGQRLTDNSQIITSGVVYNYAGLKIVESTEVTQDAGSGDDETVIMAFSSRAIPFVSQIRNVETLMNPDDFGQLIRGLYVYGGAILYPNEVTYMACTEGTEA